MFVVEHYRKGVFIYGSVNYDGYNQSNGGFGVYWENREYDDASVRLFNTTYNIVLMHAVIYAIREDIDGRGELRIFTNISYIIDTFMMWYKIWRRNDWRLSNGDRLKNLKIIFQILNAIEERVGSVCFHMFHFEDDYNDSLHEACVLARSAMRACYY